jgi:hypothetical protein
MKPFYRIKNTTDANNYPRTPLNNVQQIVTILTVLTV